MKHNFSVPTEVEMENLITKVYEALPNAEQSKLSVIESQLLRKAKRSKTKKNLNKIPWWIVLVLAGGFATAAWWAGNMIINEKKPVIIDKQSVTDDKIDQGKIKNSNEDDEVIEDKDSPIIYQRESF